MSETYDAFKVQIPCERGIIDACDRCPYLAMCYPEELGDDDDPFFNGWG